jgi:hypothetical protein
MKATTIAKGDESNSNSQVGRKQEHQQQEESERSKKKARGATVKAVGSSQDD